MSNKNIESISGVVKRLGYVNGTGQCVNLQFILENNMIVFSVFSDERSCLMTIGDKVVFDTQESIFSSNNVNIKTFRNLSLQQDLMVLNRDIIGI